MNIKFILSIIFFIIISFSMNSIEKTDKYSLLKKFPKQYVPTVELYNKNTVLEYINYPVIFKTNTCSFFARVNAAKVRQEPPTRPGPGGGTGAGSSELSCPFCYHTRKVWCPNKKLVLFNRSAHSAGPCSRGSYVPLQ